MPKPLLFKKLYTTPVPEASAFLLEERDWERLRGMVQDDIQVPERTLLSWSLFLLGNSTTALFALGSLTVDGGAGTLVWDMALVFFLVTLILGLVLASLDRRSGQLLERGKSRVLREMDLLERSVGRQQVRREPCVTEEAAATRDQDSNSR